VRCNACQHENREGRKFCASCGSALAILCRECGFANEAGERFCGGCGRPLATADAVASKSKPVAEPEGDRRPVTVLFCDLVGYTRLSSMLDPEDVHALLQRFFALVDASVDRFGGTIDKHIGDAVMALFGVPLAHGNDAERAVRAALEIQASVPALASGLPSPLAVHIGIATGEVIASSVGSQHHRGYTVTGEAANVAARLLDRASGGETFVSDAVYRATSHVVSYEAVGSLTLKGVEHAVEAWRPTELRNTGRDTSVLVGRRSELGQLRAVLDACINGSSGAAVLIRGEAGIGKTRLMDELQSIAGGSGMTCTAGFVLDFGTVVLAAALSQVSAGKMQIAPDIVDFR
jgi:class 3 adenylate cyclase